MNRIILALVVFLAALGELTTANANDTALTPLTIISGERELNFKVEIADEPEERREGLMYRKSMPLNHGMLFDYDRSQPVTMWMANTYLPLDMLFIDENGCVIGIAENTEPLSRAHISSPGPIQYVLEINAGVSKLNQISAGSRIRHERVTKSNDCS